MLGVIFRKSQNRIQDPAKLERLVELINDETWMGLDVDIKGEIYEGLLQKNAEDVKSGAGQYFTPRPLIKAMVKVIRSEPVMTICDPASLDIFWLKDDSLEDSANLPDLDIIAQDIAENLEAALEQFRSVREELGNGK